MIGWKVKKFSHAGHDVTIEYYDYNNSLEACINGPRASGISKDIYVNDFEWKVESRIPFKSPSTSKVEDKAREMRKKAVKRIEKAIAKYHIKNDIKYK